MKLNFRKSTESALYPYIFGPQASMRSLKKYIDGLRNWNATRNSPSQSTANFLLKKEGSSKQVTKNIQFKKMIYPELDKYFLRHCSSRPFEGRVHGKSLAFVVGAENSGKSEYILKNLQNLKRIKRQAASQFRMNSTEKVPDFDLQTSIESYQNKVQESLIQNPYLLEIVLDFKEVSGALNFNGFVGVLHQKVLEGIFKLNREFEERARSKLNRQKNTDVCLLSAEMIKKIVLGRNAEEYVYIYIKDVIYCILEDTDGIQFSKAGKESLKQLNDRILAEVESPAMFFNTFYQDLVSIIEKQLGVSSTVAAIKLFYSVFARIEYEHRPQEYLNSWYQSGIETTDFLFDVLNFLNGVGGFVDSLERQFMNASEEQRNRIREQAQSSKNYILRGGHVDVVLVVMNLEELSCFQNRNSQLLNLFDHWVCRTVEQSNFRRHFPLIIELPNRACLDETLQLGKIEGSNPVVIEIPGYFEFAFDSSNLIELFDKKLITRFFYKLGRNPHTWKNAIDYISSGGAIEEVFEGKAPYQKREQIIAEAKMNKLFIRETSMAYLSSRTLDLELLEILKLLKNARGLLYVSTPAMAAYVYKKPVFQGLLEENVLYHHYYSPALEVQNLTDMAFYSEQYQPDLKRLRHPLESWARNYWRRELKMFKYDYKYTAKDEVRSYERLAWGKYYLDQELTLTYHGYQMNYEINHQQTAFKRAF